MSSLPDNSHPAPTNLASGSVSLAPLAPSAVCDSPQPLAFAGAGSGVGGGPADTSPDPSLFTRERQTAFLAGLAATGVVRSAAGRAGVSHQTAYRARTASPGFRRAWDAALLAARAQAEEVLACRALDGWEEDVLYHGEVVATRRRYSDRLLLAHLSRLDRLCGDAEVAEFADSFDASLKRYAAGEDRPAQVAEPDIRCVPAEAGTSGGCAPRPEAPAFAGARAGLGSSSSGQWSTRSILRQAQDERGQKMPDHEPCPDCGGGCLGPAAALTAQDCQWLGNRLDRMDAARPRDALSPHQFPGGDCDGAIGDEQLAAFEAGVDAWWRVIPAPEDADTAVWHYLEDDEDEDDEGEDEDDVDADED